MKQIPLPSVSINNVPYKLEIAFKNNNESVCFLCELGLKRCIALYRDYEDCPCNTMCPDGYQSRCFLRAKKAGQ